MNPTQLNHLAEDVTGLFDELELELLEMIAAELAKDADKGFEEWYLLRLSAFNNLNRLTSKKAEEKSNEVSGILLPMLEMAAKGVISDAERSLIASGVQIHKTNIKALEVAENAKKSLYSDLKENIYDSFNYGQTNPAARIYDGLLRRISREVTAGVKTLERAIDDAVDFAAKQGLPSQFTDSGGRAWGIDRYAEMRIKTALQNTYNDLTASRMAEEGIYTVLVSVFHRARDACAPIQGKVVDIRPKEEADSGYPSIYDYGYGRPEGHRGCNCRHKWHAYVPNVSENNLNRPTTEQAIENERIEQGRKELARRIKRTKKRLATAKAAKTPKVNRLKKLLREQQAQMRAYVDKHGLKRDYSLEKLKN